MGANLNPPVPLGKEHLTEGFDCGNPLLNEWLIRHAWTNQRSNSSKTFVICNEDKVIGYYSLAAGSVQHEAAAVRTRKGLSNHPIPVVLLARLAVDLHYQGHKLGRWLLRDALIRTVNISEQVGIRAVLVNAKDEKARNFYELYAFEPSPIDPLQLMLLLKDIKKSIGR